MKLSILTMALTVATAVQAAAIPVDIHTRDAKLYAARTTPEWTQGRSKSELRKLLQKHMRRDEALATDPASDAVAEDIDLIVDQVQDQFQNVPAAEPFDETVVEAEDHELTARGVRRPVRPKLPKFKGPPPQRAPVHRRPTNNLPKGGLPRAPPKWKPKKPNGCDVIGSAQQGGKCRQFH